MITQDIALTNNGLLYLFSSLKLTLGGLTVEHVNYPGQGTSLLGLASYSSTFSSGCGLTQGLYPDTNTNAAANNGGFSTRQDNDALFRTAAAGAGKVVLSKRA